jgi:hypothetical protein
MRSIERQLARIKHRYLSRIIETKAKMDFKHSVVILGKKVGPFISGNHYKLDFGVAKTFIENGILDFAGEEILDVQTIQKIAFTEGRSNSLTKVDSNLFTAVKEYLDILSHKKQNNAIPQRQFTSLNSNAQDLLTVRYRKLLQLSKVKQTFKVTQNLTEEEKVFIKKLTENYVEWKSFLLNRKK